MPIDSFFWRWLGAGVLVVFEYAVLGVLVSSESMRLRVPIAAFFPRLISLAIAIGAAVVVLGGKRIREHVTEMRIAQLRVRVWLSLFAAHAVVYLGFFSLTLRLFDDPPRVTGDLRLWLLLWAASGLAALLLLVASLLPLRTAFALLWRGRDRIVAASLVGLLAALAAPLAETMWRPLSVLTLHGAALLIGLARSDLDVDLETLRLGAGDFSVIVAAPCSGIEGLALILVFVGSWLIWSREQLRWPRALLLLPIGAAAALGANVVRIAGLVAVGDRIGPEVALGAFHSRAGWVLFCFVALGLTLASKQLPFFARSSGEAAPTWNPTAAWLSPLLAAVAVALCTEAFSSGMDVLYPMRLVAALLALWLFRVDLPLPRLTPAWWAIAAGTLVFFIWVLLEPAPAPEAIAAFAAGLAELPQWASHAWIWLRVAGAVLVIPLIEEMAFRGYLLRRLVSADFTEIRLHEFHPLALALSSLAFGAIHQRWLAGTVAGATFALCGWYRGRLSDAVVAHATSNALIAAWVLSGSRFWFWI